MRDDSGIPACIADLIARHAGVSPEKIRPDSRLIDFGIDSIGATEIVLDLEMMYGISIPDRDILALDSVEATAGYLERRLREG
jgi:acyl carrier protein